ncbi:interleukin-25 [Dromiciops gliroides]|uniref:interleukin-25 n=1 Tax=Dromiciops gliroides TaxID=33562 RepID=UPI001CC43B13|nr:interleukin-25 [Dromiciops gliroides]
MAIGTQALNLRFRRDCDHHHRCRCNKDGDPSEELLKWNSMPSVPFEVPRNLQLPNTKVPEPFQCRASPDGPLNSRAISPWSYELDRDENRLPQDLYHARCLCPHCVSLKTRDIDQRGNSELLWHNQTVFYRRPCHSRGAGRGSDCYYLERKVYPVSFACICVLPRMMA